VQKKISLVGAGNIGGTLALLAAQKHLGNIVLLDSVEGMPQGKALDLCQMGACAGFEPIIHGSNTLTDLSGSDVVIITAGLPRKPGMSREDLLKTNATIIKGVAENVKAYCPNAFVIVITNPLDAMVWYFQQVSQLPHERVVGMAGVLDSARFRLFLSQEFNVSIENTVATVLGGHGDTMVPLLKHSSIAGVSLLDLVQQKKISEQRLAEIVQRTRHGGGEIVNLLKNGSAFYAPAASAIAMAESYLKNQRRTLPCAAYLSGQYKAHNLYMGVPVVLGEKGVEEILEYPLSQQERNMMDASIKAVQSLIEELKKAIE
jgi:malate dehydrogenase